jgi:hypothetical protein
MLNGLGFSVVVNPAIWCLQGSCEREKKIVRREKKQIFNKK